MPYSRIVGIGHHVPDRIVTNQYLSTLMDTNNDWIVERTGIHERRWIDPSTDTVANMAAKASRMALERAGLSCVVGGCPDRSDGLQTLQVSARIDQDQSGYNVGPSDRC